MKIFRKLMIWGNGLSLTKDVHLLAKQLPDSDKFGLVSQMIRSAVSFPGNIAEGCFRNSDNELFQFFENAVGSSFEPETQLLIAKDIYDLNIGELLDKLTQEQKMLNSYHAKLLNNPNAKC